MLPHNLLQVKMLPP